MTNKHCNSQRPAFATKNSKSIFKKDKPYLTRQYKEIASNSKSAASLNNILNSLSSETLHKVSEVVLQKAKNKTTQRGNTNTQKKVNEGEGMDIEVGDEGLKSTSPDTDISINLISHEDTVKYFHEDIENESNDEQDETKTPGEQMNDNKAETILSTQLGEVRGAI